MTIIEDNGINQIFECEIDIDIKLKDDNYIVFIPSRIDSNLFELNYIMNSNFSAKKPTSINIWIIISCIIAAIILIIIFVLIIYFKCCKKKKHSIDDDINEPILTEMELNTIQ